MPGVQAEGRVKILSSVRSRNRSRLGGSCTPGQNGKRGRGIPEELRHYDAAFTASSAPELLFSSIFLVINKEVRHSLAFWGAIGQIGFTFLYRLIPRYQTCGDLRIFYRCHNDRILRTRSFSTGSFVLMWIAKRCGPPIPSCIVNLVETSVSCPGCKVVEPTTAPGGQQPSMASTCEFITKRRG